MKIREGVDFGIAFEVLKYELNKSEELWAKGEMGAAFGHLTGSVTAVINHCTEPEIEPDKPTETDQKQNSVH